MHLLGASDRGLEAPQPIAPERCPVGNGNGVHGKFIEFSDQSTASSFARQSRQRLNFPTHVGQFLLIDGGLLKFTRWSR